MIDVTDLEVRAFCLAAKTSSVDKPNNYNVQTTDGRVWINNFDTIRRYELWTTTITVTVTIFSGYSSIVTRTELGE